MAGLSRVEAERGKTSDGETKRAGKRLSEESARRGRRARRWEDIFRI